MKNILLIVAQDGFQTKEYGDTKHELENLGHKVVTASMSEGGAVSNIGEHVAVDTDVAHVDITKVDAVYAIGGPGALHSLDNDVVRNLFVRFMNETNKPYGAICVSSRILAMAGVLKGIHVTGWNADRKLEDVLKNARAIYVEEPVVADGRVITADGPSSAAAFGQAIAKTLQVS